MCVGGWVEGAFILPFIPKVNCTALGKGQRGGAFGENISVLRDQFTRCVWLTFTVTVITSGDFPAVTLITTNTPIPLDDELCPG